MKFTSAETPNDDSQLLNVSCSFQMNLQAHYELQKGQALITFEKEEGMTHAQECDHVTFGKHLDSQRAFIELCLLLCTFYITFHLLIMTHQDSMIIPIVQVKN